VHKFILVLAGWCCIFTPAGFFMQKAKAVFRVLSNKYVIAVILFAVLMLFVDKNDVFVQAQRKKQLNDLLASKKFYEAEIEKTKKNLAELGDSSSLEKYARETYLMKKDNEDIFVVDTAAGSEKK
jgi:cell division protein FtsB